MDLFFDVALTWMPMSLGIILAVILLQLGTSHLKKMGLLEPVRYSFHQQLKNAAIVSGPLLIFAFATLEIIYWGAAIFMSLVTFLKKEGLRFKK